MYTFGYLRISIWVWILPFEFGIQSLITQYPFEYFTTSVRISVWKFWIGYEFGYWIKCPGLRWFIQLGCFPISWKTQKHDIMSRLSAELEYQAMTDTVSELLRLREPSYEFGKSVWFFCYASFWLSLSATNYAVNTMYHAQTKHAGLDFDFVHGENIRGTTSTKHVYTKSQLAGFFTKSLESKVFDTLSQ